LAAESAAPATDWRVQTFGITIHNDLTGENTMSLEQSCSRTGTSSRPKNVAPESDRSRALRALLAWALRFLRREIPIPQQTDGDLSSWLFYMHGLTEEGPQVGYKQENMDSIAPLVTLLSQFGPDLNPRIIMRARTQSGRTRDNTVCAAAHADRPGTSDDIRTAFPRAATEIASAWGAPPEFSERFTYSIGAGRQLLRAVHAMLVCLVLHKTSLLTLVVEASTGQRQAVLDLVKVDKLFLHDHCTERVIKEAELRTDHDFIQQLARAQEYRFPVSSRNVYHLYFCLVFLLEHLGFTLPSAPELWRILDPQEKDYGSLVSFRKDLQRHHQDFQRMLVQLSEFKDWSSPSRNST